MARYVVEVESRPLEMESDIIYIQRTKMIQGEDRVEAYSNEKFRANVLKPYEPKPTEEEGTSLSNGRPLNEGRGIYYDRADAFIGSILSLNKAKVKKLEELALTA